MARYSYGMSLLREALAKTSSSVEAKSDKNANTVKDTTTETHRHRDKLMKCTCLFSDIFRRTTHINTRTEQMRCALF